MSILRFIRMTLTFIHQTQRQHYNNCLGECCCGSLLRTLTYIYILESKHQSLPYIMYYLCFRLFGQSFFCIRSVKKQNNRSSSMVVVVENLTFVHCDHVAIYTKCGFVILLFDILYSVSSICGFNRMCNNDSVVWLYKT